MVSSLLVICGAITSASAQTINVLMVARCLIGSGIGIASMIIPVYLSEVAPNRVRGSVVAASVVAIAFGQVIGGIVALYCYKNWRLMFGLECAPAFIQLVGAVFLPESQRWLAGKYKHEEVMNVLK